MRHTQSIDRDELDSLQHGDAGARDQLSNALVAAQQYVKRRLDPGIPYEEYFGWVVKTVKWGDAGGTNMR
jgi:hypothetical protein